MMSKGVTGKILTFIMSLILGIIALAFLWFFLSEGTNIITESVQKIITSIRCNMFCREIFGRDIGMCSGC